jgi:hypothetical protein
MPSPMTVSLEVPYAENEQQFLVLAVQTAVKTFRSLHASPVVDEAASQSSVESLEASACSSIIEVLENKAKGS